MKKFPWWGSVLLAIASYFGLKNGAQYILAEDSPLFGLIPLFAPLIAMGFLLLAGKQLYDDEGVQTPPSDENPDSYEKEKQE